MSNNCTNICVNTNKQCKACPLSCSKPVNQCMPKPTPTCPIRSQNCNERVPTCTNMPQPVSPPNPALNLDGENCLSCYANRTLLTKPSDLNSVLVSLTNPQLKTFLTTPLVLPTCDANKAQYVVDPPVTPLPAAKCAFPPVPPSPIPVGNRRVLIVGGAKGLGKATAQYLSANGFNVIATSSHPDCYPPLPPGTRYVLSKQALDVRLESCVNEFFDRVIRPLGSLDAMLFFPGVQGAFLHESTGDDLRNMLELKLFGFQRCAKAAIPYLRNGVNPRVISFSSVGGGESYFVFSNAGYTISNHALVMLNDNLMLEERILYGCNQITNPITFSVVEPEVILSTIALYQEFKPSNVDLNNIWLDFSLSLFGCAQAGGLASLGFPAYDPIYVAQDMYNILVAPQPAVRYLVGNPSGVIPGPTGPLSYPEWLQYVNTVSQDELISSYIIPSFAPFINTPTINLLKSISYSIYFT